MKKTAFALCLLIFLDFLQALLMPKYMAPEGREGALISEYYSSGFDHDVIFIGDCEVYENVSPVKLWEEYGITSWIRGSPQQTIWQSYYLMEETFRYETPRVMVFNVLAMKYDTPESTGSFRYREAYNRMTLDGMRWSASKLKSVQASMTDTERQWGGIWTYLFPILRYHDRWHQLTQEDLTYWLKRDVVSDNGYLMQTGVKPADMAYAEAPRADYTFSENCWDYLRKMVDLCAEHGTQLVLIKAPSLYPVWWWEWETQMEDFARENGLLYINMLEYQQEIGINWNEDTYDAGLHLNVSGAEKTSVWFGSILSEICGVPDRRENTSLALIWEEKIRIYYERKESMLP